MIRLLLFCVLIGFVNSAIADNVVLILRGIPFPEEEYFDESFGHDFGEMLDSMNVKARIVDLGDLGKVINFRVDDNSTKSQLGPSDRIIGFLIHAHGSTQSLGFYSNDTSTEPTDTHDLRWVSGEHFADMLIEIFPFHQISDEFFVYLYCCDQGGKSRKGINFQDEFYLRLKQRLLEAEVPLKRLVVFAFTQETGVGAISSAFVDRRIKDLSDSSRLLKLPLEWMRYTQSDAAVQRQLDSPVRRMINWHPSGYNRPARAIALLLVGGWVVSDFFGLGLGSGAFASLGLHAWAVHNGFIGRSLARVRQWTPLRESEEKSSIRALQRKYLPLGRCSQALKT
ncbi:MAG: hypothetical protein IPK68_10670 [Bdellovibrionales bacterium]|nr:hypothetical protein [Bdellovibrionales bacterium]